MNAPETKRIAPPYVAYPTFKNMVSGFKEHVLPGRIDRSVLSNFSGIVGSQLLTTLRFLSLIDGQNHPTPELRELVDAYGSDKWEAAIAKVLRGSYAPIFELDLTAASPAQFSERFTKSYPAEGSTLRKSLTFFLGAVADAKIPVSPYITKNKKPRGPTPGKRRSKPNGNKTADRGPGGAAEKKDPPPFVPETQRALSQLVLEALDPNTMSLEETQAFLSVLTYLRKQGK